MRGLERTLILGLQTIKTEIKVTVVVISSNSLFIDWPIHSGTL